MVHFLCQYWVWRDLEIWDLEVVARLVEGDIARVVGQVEGLWCRLVMTHESISFVVIGSYKNGLVCGCWYDTFSCNMNKLDGQIFKCSSLMNIISGHARSILVLFFSRSQSNQKFSSPRTFTMDMLCLTGTKWWLVSLNSEFWSQCYTNTSFYWVHSALLSGQATHSWVHCCKLLIPLIFSILKQFLSILTSIKMV